MQYLKLFTRIELESTVVAAELIISKVRDKLAARATGSCKAHLRQEIKAKKAEAKGCVDAAFAYFSNQLEANAVHNWEIICACECDTLEYIARKSKVFKGVA